MNKRQKGVFSKPLLTTRIRIGLVLKYSQVISAGLRQSKWSRDVQVFDAESGCHRVRVSAASVHLSTTVNVFEVSFAEVVHSIIDEWLYAHQLQRPHRQRNTTEENLTINVFAKYLGLLPATRA